MYKSQSGFTLIEVLVALVIFSLGVLGVGAMLIVMHKTSTSSYLRQEAVQYAYDIVDKMRANQATALAGAYNVGPPPTNVVPVVPTCVAVVCTPAALAAYDQSEWLSQVTTHLPVGKGAIVTAPVGAGPSTQVTVNITWDDTPTQNTLGEAVTVANYTLITVL